MLSENQIVRAGRSEDDNGVTEGFLSLTNVAVFSNGANTPYFNCESALIINTQNRILLDKCGGVIFLSCFDNI